jgi:hypothetical protein
MSDDRNDREFDLTEDDIEAMYEEQQGRCHATFVPISLRRGEWQASVDRIDDDLGHTRDNVELSALEVNNHIHWTKELTRQLISKSSQKFGDYDAVATELLAVRVNDGGTQTFTWPVIQRGEESFVYCHKCAIEKPLSEFGAQRSSGCQACRSRVKAVYRKTWRGVFSQLLSRSKYSTKRRNHKGRNHDHTVDLEHIVELFVQQEGRCFYSRAPLSVEEGPFRCSLERINVGLGYVKGNVVIICAMLNSIDRHGDTGWSREKFLHMQKHFQAHDVAS